MEPVVEETQEEEEGSVPAADGEGKPAPERQVNYVQIVVTEVTSPNSFWAQHVDQGVWWESDV